MPTNNGIGIDGGSPSMVAIIPIALTRTSAAHYFTLQYRRCGARESVAVHNVQPPPYATVAVRLSTCAYRYMWCARPFDELRARACRWLAISELASCARIRRVEWCARQVSNLRPPV